MSDLTSPKKRPQRPAAPSWAARRRPRPDGPDSRASEPDSRAAPATEETPSATPAGSLRVPRPEAPRSGGADRGRDEESAGAAASPAADEPEGAGAVEPKSATTWAAETLPPGQAVAAELRGAASEEPETVSLRDIETLLSPGKAPPRLPAAGARPGAGRLGGAGPTAVKTAPRGGDTHSSDLAAMAALVPAPRPTGARSAWPPPNQEEAPASTLERALPNPLESSASDFELMGMMAATAPKPVETKPVWTAPKSGAQARAATVAVVSSAAAAALKGTPPPGATAAGPSPWRPVGSTGPAPMRSPTLRSTAVTAERPPLQGKGVVIPPPPVRVGPAPRRADSAEVDEGWATPSEGTGFSGERPRPQPEGGMRTTGEHGRVEAASLRTTGEHARVAQAASLRATGEHGRVTLEAGMRTTGEHGRVDVAAHGSATERARALHDATAASSEALRSRALEALALRAGPRGSLPDPSELLRDTGRSGGAGAHGSVVDPLELYGAITPAKGLIAQQVATPAATSPAASRASDPMLPRAPEQTLPKVMLQPPTKAAPDARLEAAALANAEFKAAAAALAAAEARAAEAALAAAEARAAVAAAEANAAALRPKVDLPPRIEPRPFPKPPVRPAAARAAATASAAAAKIEAKPATLPKVPATPPAPSLLKTTRSGVAAAVWDSAPEPLADDEIPVDITPDPIESGEAEAAPRMAPVESNSDSGRFDLHQLMSARESSRPSAKGLADADLFGLAGDLFNESDAGRIRPPDPAALLRPAPLSSRLLGPVASVAATTSLAPPTTRGERPLVKPSRARAFTPWVLLPVLAMAAAVFMVWRGREVDPAGEPRTGATSPQHETMAPPSAPALPATVATRPTAEEPSLAGSGAPSAAKSGEPAATSPAGVWKPPSSTTSTTTSTTTAPTANTPVPTAPTATTPVPTATAPQASGGDFNEGAARASLRNAAGAAGGCAHDKPGVANVAITFAPSGRVTSSQVSGGFAGTTTGGCIASAMRGASVPSFEGGPVSVNWKVTLR